MVFSTWRAPPFYTGICNPHQGAITQGPIFCKPSSVYPRASPALLSLWHKLLCGVCSGLNSEFNAYVLTAMFRRLSRTGMRGPCSRWARPDVAPSDFSDPLTATNPGVFPKMWTLRMTGNFQRPFGFAGLQ